MAARAVAAAFPAVIETIDTGGWNISSWSQISSSNAQGTLGCVEKESMVVVQPPIMRKVPVDGFAAE
jgi:hypothetical protein